MDGRIQGQLDIPLDDTGHAQAAAVAEVFAAADLFAIGTSDLLRAAATADVVAIRTGLVAERDERLREIDLGRWQGLTAQEAKQRFPIEFAAWRSGEDVARGGGETYAEAGARAAGWLRELLEVLPPGRTALAVTHGGTARGALGVMLELPVEHWWRLAPLGNACWSVLLEGERGWRLERHNGEVGGQLGAVAGAYDIGAAAVIGMQGSRDADPVK